MKLRVLSLYRPEVPLLRAQSIQVLHTSAALARRGHQVTVFAQRHAGFKGDAAEALRTYGLEEQGTLDLQVAPVAHLGLSGLWFRARVAAWLAGSRSDALPVIYAREKRHIVEVLRLRPLRRFALCFEAHEVDSAQRRERGQDDTAARALERRVLAGAQALITNCEGTLQVLEETHPGLLPPLRLAIHNGTDPGRTRPLLPHAGKVAGYVGSPEGYKDVPVLLAAAGLLPPAVRLRIVGGIAGSDAYAAVQQQAGPNIDLRPAVPYGEVPDVLAGLDALLACLADDLYGRRLASPLKLWDYLATGLPVVAPDLPSIRQICGDAFYAYAPGDAASMAAAIARAMVATPAAPRVRTWDDRASEVEAVLERIAGGAA